MNIDAITVLILTWNEEPNIERTLRALKRFSRILIIDSESTDGTPARARAAHSRVTTLQRPFDTHATQWNFGLANVSTEWVLTLDADYEVSPELSSEVESLELIEAVSGYSAEFEYRIFGRPLRASVYPPRVVLFRRSRGQYFDDGHTQRLRLDGAVVPLTSLIYHDDRKPLGRWLKAQDQYAALEADHLQNAAELNSQDRLRKAGWIAPVLMPIYLLFVRGLLLDGWAGWYYVCQRSIAEMLLSLHLLGRSHALPATPSPDSNRTQ
jgi:glycosyltransferase involved in cell wall biosynthesis